MCDTCGCADPAGPVRLTAFRMARDEKAAGHDDAGPIGHAPADGDGDGDGDGGARTMALEQAILARNDDLAAASRARIATRGILAVNLMSSPGAGKTTLLERTVRDLAPGHRVAVVEGDQESVRDAERIRSAGVPVVQINTGRGCHLDAAMVDQALRALGPEPGTMVFVENVGNLVCPALFDLGETARVVLVSVTEGEDKPVKYPHMFARADLVVLTKCDLLPYLGLERDRLIAGIRRVNPGAEVMELSGLHRTETDRPASSTEPGTGLSGWYAWLRHRHGAQLANAGRQVGGV